MTDAVRLAVEHRAKLPPLVITPLAEGLGQNASASASPPSPPSPPPPPPRPSSCAGVSYVVGKRFSGGFGASLRVSRWQPGSPIHVVWPGAVHASSASRASVFSQQLTRRPHEQTLVLLADGGGGGGGAKARAGQVELRVRPVASSEGGAGGEGAAAEAALEAAMASQPALVCGSACAGAYMSVLKSFSRSFSATVRAPPWEARAPTPARAPVPSADPCSTRPWVVQVRTPSWETGALLTLVFDAGPVAVGSVQHAVLVDSSPTVATFRLEANGAGPSSFTFTAQGASRSAVVHCGAASPPPAPPSPPPPSPAPAPSTPSQSPRRSVFGRMMDRVRFRRSRSRGDDGDSR